MAKRFKSVQSLANYITNASKGGMLNNRALERELAKRMSKAVEDYVYAVYTPESYVRRKKDGGLSDERNMQITNISIENNKLVVRFENLTKGNDNLDDTTIADLIEGGEGTNDKHWAALGEWSKPRPFVAPLQQQINANPQVLLKAIKQDLMSKGFRFK